jgi:putative ABC transport system permease protein
VTHRIFASSLRVGVETLRSNPLRTILSTLGVILGVASLVAVLSIGDGMERFVRGEIERTTDLQTNMVNPAREDEVGGVRLPRTDFARFGLADAESLAARLGGMAQVSIGVNGAARASRDGADSSGAAAVMATTAAAEERLRPTYVAGRFFSEGEVRDSVPVAVVSHGLARGLGGGEDGTGLLGQVVRLEGTAFRVVGVLAPQAKERRWSATVPFTLAERALAPTTAVRPVRLLARVARVEEVDSAIAVMRSWVAGRGGGATVDASPQGRIDQAQQGIRMFKLALGAFAGISLIVGGLGIMNVLLAAVIERTREIGIRKATGARQRDILAQFLSESVAISGAGSVLGAALGLGGASLVTAVMRAKTGAQVHAGFTWTSVMVAAGVAIVTGLAFGTYPALRAARISPIDAIRHE